VPPWSIAFFFLFPDASDLRLAELLALAFGNPDGGPTVEQELNDVIDVEIIGNPLHIGIPGGITMATVNELPTGLLVDRCIDFLAGP